ncbi:hypothetical protein G7046_g7607 [Stylonectria norvegica]|nr:hypothetical protein G7046_g7607 [Stylonectria norvegica]
MAIDELLLSHIDDIRVDVLHLSPPCQYFSPAHTHAGANDEVNIDALTGGNALIHKIRPRIITLEQTFGITHDQHAEYFRQLISEFTQYGYSVRWKIVRLCTWGAAQDRKRLIMIAAAPGEALPTFPSPTHGDDERLEPFSTMRHALRGLRAGDDLHDLDKVKYYNPRRPAYNPDRLSDTITTGGSSSGFYDGTRDFTLREYANLQGFPKSHRFLGTRTSIKRQIGNAFPPNTVRVLYQHIEKWLLKEDRMKPYQPPIEDVVMIDDEDSEVSVLEDDFEFEASPEMDEDILEVVDSNRNRRRRIDFEDDQMVIDLT